MLKICIPFLLIFLAACNNESTTTANKDSLVNSNPDTSVKVEPQPNLSGHTGCYLSVLNRDTIVASLQQNGDSITGKLNFDNYQKDGSSGVVRGVINNGIMKLFYSFASEGMNSVMDIQFKVQGDSLIRGIGDIDVKGDTAYFTKPDQIKFSGSVLHRIPCQMIPIKFR